VRREAGIPGNALASVTQAVGDSVRVVGWVDDVWRDVQLMPYNWRWMQAGATGTLSPGIMAYDFNALTGGPADRFGSWRKQTRSYRPVSSDPAAPTTEWGLTWLPYDDFAARFLVGDHMAGPPAFYSVSPANELMIGPKPDIAYTFKGDYRKSPQVLSADGDLPEMPSHFHSMLVWRALAEYGVYDAAPEVLGRAADRSESMLTSLISEQGEQITWASEPLA
jgi:hypothetical protein